VTSTSSLCGTSTWRSGDAVPDLLDQLETGRDVEFEQGSRGRIWVPERCRVRAARARERLQADLGQLHRRRVLMVTRQSTGALW
jgi:hypothetical protein